MNLKWMDAANCATTDPELFYLIPKETERSERARNAFKVCSSCTVADECLQWALATGDEWGILGGKTAAMRSEMT